RWAEQSEKNYVRIKMNAMRVFVAQSVDHAAHVGSVEFRRQASFLAIDLVQPRKRCPRGLQSRIGLLECLGTIRLEAERRDQRPQRQSLADESDEYDYERHEDHHIAPRKRYA